MPITPLISGEAVRAAYAAAPEYVKDAFDSEVTTEAITRLQEAYKIHVDVVGELGKEVGYLLLGLTSPVEFLNRLVRGGLDESTALHITEEVNKQIFTPLRAKLQSNTTSSSTPVATPLEKSPAPAGSSLPGPSTAVPVEAPPPQVEPTPRVKPIEQKIDEVTAVQTPVFITPERASAPTPERVETKPAMRTMAHDVELMNRGDATVRNAVAQPTIEPSVPIPIPQPVSPKEPSMAPYVPSPREDTELPRQTLHTTSPSRKEITDTLKQYGIDPYREPVE